MHIFLPILDGVPWYPRRYLDDPLDGTTGLLTVLLLYHPGSLKVPLSKLYQYQAANLN